jgi:formamidopyrimidine-DNA glycosylase
MPELPEAETIRRQIAKKIIGKDIREASITDPAILRYPPDVRRFCRHIKKCHILAVTRRGKAIVCRLDSEQLLVIRLGMSGTMKVVPADVPFDRHVHFRLRFADNNELRLRDPRKFGGVYLRDGSNVDALPEFSHYGPDALSDEFNADYLAAALRGRKVLIGVVLMDQHLVAGIGKIYSDEACWRTKVAPTRPAGSLSRAEIKRLAAAVKECLTEAIGVRGTTAGDNSYVDTYGLAGGFRPATYARTGQPCPRCDTPIQRTRMGGGRGLHYCPKCQK